MKFSFKDIKKMYEDYTVKYGKDARKYISQLFDEAKPLHKEAWNKNPTAKGDHEQSWRAFKGKNMQKLFLDIMKSEVENLGLKLIDGGKIERAKNLSFELDKVKRNLLIHYGEFGSHLPDVDIIIYDPKSYNIVCVISSKVTMRERIAQTGYWKLKLLQSEVTNHIKVYFMTPDEDGHLTRKKPAHKGRAIVEEDLDGSYVFTDVELDESDKVKLSNHFIDDLQKLIQSDTKIKSKMMEKPKGDLDNFIE